MTTVTEHHYTPEPLSSDSVRKSEPMYKGNFTDLWDECIMQPKLAAIEIANLTVRVRTLQKQIDKLKSGEPK